MIKCLHDLHLSFNFLSFLVSIQLQSEAALALVVADEVDAPKAALPNLVKESKFNINSDLWFGGCFHFVEWCC
jgi:hypothetical protein